MIRTELAGEEATDAIRGLSKRQIELIKAIQIDSIRAKTERKISLRQMSHILITHSELKA